MTRIQVPIGFTLEVDQEVWAEINGIENTPDAAREDVKKYVINRMGAIEGSGDFLDEAGGRLVKVWKRRDGMKGKTDG